MANRFGRNNDAFFFGGGDGYPGPRWGEQALFAAQIPNLPTPQMGQRGFNPFQPMLPNNDWINQHNALGAQRILLSQAQAPERRKLDLLAGLLGPNGSLGKLLSGLGQNLGGLNLGGGLTGFQSTNGPQRAGLLSGLGG